MKDVEVTARWRVVAAPVTIMTKAEMDALANAVVPCPRCNGHCFFDDDPCTRCAGKGVVWKGDGRVIY